MSSITPVQDLLPSLSETGFWSRLAIARVFDDWRSAPYGRRGEETLDLCRAVLRVSAAQLRRDLAADVFPQIFLEVMMSDSWSLTARAVGELAGQNRVTRKQLVQALLNDSKFVSAPKAACTALSIGAALEGGAVDEPLMRDAVAYLRRALSAPDVDDLHFQAVHALGKIACAPDSCGNSLRLEIAEHLAGIFSSDDQYVRRGVLYYLEKMQESCNDPELRELCESTLEKFSIIAATDGRVRHPRF